MYNDKRKDIEDRALQNRSGFLNIYSKLENEEINRKYIESSLNEEDVSYLSLFDTLYKAIDMNDYLQIGNIFDFVEFDKNAYNLNLLLEVKNDVVFLKNVLEGKYDKPKEPKGKSRL